MKTDIQLELETLDANALLHHVNHKNVFKVPKQYFTDVEERLANITTPKHEVFQVPSDYFQTVEQAIFNRIEATSEQNTETKETSINFRQYMMMAASVIVLLSSIFIMNNQSDSNQNSTLAGEEIFAMMDPDQVDVYTEPLKSVYDGLHEDLYLSTASQDVILDPIFDDIDPTISEIEDYMIE